MTFRGVIRMHSSEKQGCPIRARNIELSGNVAIHSRNIMRN